VIDDLWALIDNAKARGANPRLIHRVLVLPIHPHVAERHPRDFL